MKHETRNPFAAGLFASALLLTGCSSPHVRVEIPTQAEAVRYDYQWPAALAYADRTKKAYQQKIADQTALNEGLGAGLITLGGIIAGLAAFDAHSDALVGASLLGGTSYALGNWGSSQPRQLVYVAGSEGISCAVKAVEPLYLPEQDRNDFKAEVVALRESISTAIEAQAAYQKSSSVDQSRLDQSKKEITEASENLTAGQILSRKMEQAPLRLVLAVDRLNDAVDRALLETIPNLNAIGGVIGNLAGFSAMFAPGAGVDASLNSALAGFQPELQTEEISLDSGPLTDLTISLTQMKTHANAVKARLESMGEQEVFNNLDGCGVDTTDIGFGVTGPEKVTVRKTSQTVHIPLSGGKKPYMTRFMESPVKGLNIMNPQTFDNTVTLSLNQGENDKPEVGTYSLLVTDSADPVHQHTIQLVVAGDGLTTGNGGGGNPSGGNGAGDILLNANPLAELDGIKVTVEVAEKQGEAKKWKVQLSCQPDQSSNNKCLDQQAIKGKLIELRRETLAPTFSASLGATDAAAMEALLIDEAASSSCNLCPPAETQGAEILLNPSAEVVKNVGCDAIRAVQSRLHVIADCIWGKRSQAALEIWRGQTGSDDQGPLTAGEVDLLRVAVPAQ